MGLRWGVLFEFDDPGVRWGWVMGCGEIDDDAFGEMEVA